MALSILHAFVDWSQSHFQVCSKYHNAPSNEAGESYALTAHSHDDCGFDAPESAKSTPEESRKLGFIERYRRRFSGWRFGVLHFAAWASIVFTINLIITIWSSVTHGKNKGLLMEGDCAQIKRLNSGLHILINILSTILLSGSNYCMQCLSAPTRKEIDKAHASRKWLDIGIPSVRNLRHISRRRLVLWLLLGGSSVPLHLLFNSAVYASISTNDYNVFGATEEFLNDFVCRNCENRSQYPDILKDLWSKSGNNTLDKLSVDECLTAYGTTIQSTRRNLFIVTDNTHYSPNSDNNVWVDAYYQFSAVGVLSTHDVLRWMCSGLPYESSQCQSRIGEIPRAPRTWVVLGNSSESTDYQWPVNYCLSERSDSPCRLYFSTLVAAIVTTLNFFKAVLMFSIVFLVEDHPLMTMGDAVASFLDERDIETSDMDLHTTHNAKESYSTFDATYDPPIRRWKDATSKKRRFFALLLITITLIVVIALLIYGLNKIKESAYINTLTSLSMGFGAVDSRALISGESLTKDIVSLAIIANSPQILLSFIYFTYNGLFTAMLMGFEWISYSYKKKGLRVSREPSGFQRSTYFLQLPYRFGIPIAILSGTLHWLVSQSIFVVSFDMYDSQGFPYPDSDWFQPKTCGFSPIAMLVVIILGVFMMATIIGFGFIPYKPGIPLAGSCSLAISAACHPGTQNLAEGAVLSEQELQWGIVSTSADGVRHGAFSSEEVEPLVKDRRSTLEIAQAGITSDGLMSEEDGRMNSVRK